MKIPTRYFLELWSPFHEMILKFSFFFALLFEHVCVLLFQRITATVRCGISCCCCCWLLPFHTFICVCVCCCFSGMCVCVFVLFRLFFHSSLYRFPFLFDLALFLRFALVKNGKCNGNDITIIIITMFPLAVLYGFAFRMCHFNIWPMRLTLPLMLFIFLAHIERGERERENIHAPYELYVFCTYNESEMNKR